MMVMYRADEKFRGEGERPFGFSLAQLNKRGKLLYLQYDNGG
jgi:hypothetical protein